jgi:hypothetical protein
MMGSVPSFRGRPSPLRTAAISAGSTAIAGAVGDVEAGRAWRQAARVDAEPGDLGGAVGSAGAGAPT